jgi:membrane dipeptidase
MIDDCWLLKSAMSPLGLLFKKIKRIHKWNPFIATIEILNHFERAVALARDLYKYDVIIAKSITELEQGIADKKIVFIHAIEGGHSLGGDLNHLQSFYNHGVCMITLAHFYENEITQTVGGIPSDKKFLGCFKGEKVQQGGLSDLGKEVVSRMFNLGMIVDLTHCTPKARQEVYDINNNQKPLLFSHTGVSAKNDTPMNPTDDEIGILADCGGAVGVIFMNHWLDPGDQKDGLDLIVNTIKHIVNSGGIETVAIGSDFDGFTDPPDDIKDISEMPKLPQALSKAGFSSDDIDKIMGQNALRVLKTGWLKT